MDIFEDSVEYKGFSLYPFLVKDGYSLFKTSQVLFALPKQYEKKKQYLKQSYYEYIITKAKDEKKPQYLGMLTFVLSTTFGKEDILLEPNGFYVCLKTDKFESSYDEYLSYYKKIESEDCQEIDVLNFNKIESLIYNKVFFDTKDFDYIKDFICGSNGVNTQVFSAEWEGKLDKMLELSSKAVDGNQPNFNDLVRALAFYLKKEPKEIGRMKILDFDHYLNMLYDYERYQTTVKAMIAGASSGKELKHWITHYEPKNKYSSIIKNDSSEELKKNI